MQELGKHHVDHCDDPVARRLYRTSGISAALLGVGYLVIIAVYVGVGIPPNGVEEQLGYLGRNTNV